MPELPEVQTVVNYLIKPLSGKSIIAFKAIWPRVFENFNGKDLLKENRQLTILTVYRRAKFIIIQLEKQIIAIHLRMTGKLYIMNNKKLPKHTTAFLKLNNGSLLVFEDVRKFGRMYSYKNLDIINSKHGIEPLSKMFKLDNLQNLILSKKRNIKALLLDQSLIVGLGNIYVDETLWRSGIHPLSSSNLIPNSKLIKLYDSIIIILSEAIKAQGTTIINFSVNGESGKYSSKLKVYGQDGKKCENCKSTILKLKVCGRGTYICMKCQRKYSNKKF
jgi:formamidopyrimidine-DNA glycosylase